MDVRELVDVEAAHGCLVLAELCEQLGLLGESRTVYCVEFCPRGEKPMII